MIPEKLFINLRILSKIQKNGRIRRSYDGIISLENEHFYQSFKRFLTSDSRKQSVYEINSVINECVECLSNIINSKFLNKMYYNTDEYYKCCEDLELLVTELDSAKVGIENLKFTYKIDANTSTQLDIIIVKIKSTIKDTTNKLNYFKSFLPNTEQSGRESAPTYYVHETNTNPNPNTNQNYSETQSDT